MSDSLTDLILSLTPEDGSSIGNGAMIALLRDYMPDLTDETYAQAKDALIEEGVLGRGRGRGGSIYRADVTDLELTAPVAKEPKAPASTAPRKTAARKSDEPPEVLSYRHGETRVNNPEVGIEVVLVFRPVLCRAALWHGFHITRQVSCLLCD